MSKTTVHEWGGVLLTLFQLDAGEKVVRHNHKRQGITHTTGVAKGSTEVEIWSDPPQKFQMLVGDRDYVFDMDTDHEITALEDGTIVVNLSHSLPRDGETVWSDAPAKSGGVLLHDGTIIFESSHEGEKIIDAD